MKNNSGLGTSGEKKKRRTGKKMEWSRSSREHETSASWTMGEY
jgi:hypothetical protein